MSNPQMKHVIEYLETADETGLPLSLLRRHIERVGEKGVCDSQLTVLHRTGLDTDLYEAARAGTLDKVDRTIFRHLLGLPPNSSEASKNVASYDSETGLYTFEVNYSESLAEKTAESERSPESLAWVTDYATDEKFPDERTGTHLRTGRTMHFNKSMGQEGVEAWANEHFLVLARGKELIDFSKSFPGLALDGKLPLAAAGQFWSDSRGLRCYLYLSQGGEERDLGSVWLDPDGQWRGRWRFLVLDK